MKAAVRSFRGLDRADIDIGGIVLVLGANGAGKSSLLQGIGCALTGTASPIEGIAKKDLNTVVRAGVLKGSATVKTDKGSVTMSYPKGEPSSDGEPPQATTFAVGLSHILDLEPKVRADILSRDYISAVPTKDDLKLELSDLDISPEDRDVLVDKIWEIVEAQGWDGAAKECAEQGTKLKGAWEQATGGRYGSKIAADWKPQGWTPDMADLDEEVSAAASQKAATALEQAIATAAVDAAELEQIRARAAGLDDAVTDLQAKGDLLRAADGELEAADKTLLENPSPDSSSPGMPCPHCSKRVSMRHAGQGRWEITKTPEQPAPAALKAQREAFAAADGNQKRRKTEQQQAYDAFKEAERAVAGARSAADTLQTANTSGATATAVDKARAAAAAAAATERAVKAYNQAHGLHARIMRAVVIVRALGPDGVRRSKLLRQLDAFNKRKLEPLCAAAGWPAVKLGPDLGALYGDRSYGLCSGSEKWRARAVLQIAMALEDHSALICLDGADILLPQGRRELIGMLTSIEVPVVIGMAWDREKDAPPDLKAAEIGATYWVQDGTVAALS